jgi:ribosomal protein S7
METSATIATTTAFTLANEPRVGSSVEIGPLQQQELATLQTTTDTRERQKRKIDKKLAHQTDNTFCRLFSSRVYYPNFYGY